MRWGVEKAWEMWGGWEEHQKGREREREGNRTGTKREEGRRV
jgi:hypothetical protein